MSSLFTLIFVILCLALREASSHLGQQCDWNGSGLSAGMVRGVTPVYLRCREGRVGWSYPWGALRVLLRLGSSPHREFRACLRPGPHFEGASLYLEGPRSLTKIYSAQDAHKRTVRCFQSRGGQAALYFESTGPAGTAHKQIAEFSYDLQPLPRGQPYDPSEECRPCTKEEMTQAYCTSELVARGIIQKVEPIEGTDVSEMTLKVTKALRTTDWGENEVTEDVGERAVVQVARHCGAQHGSGELIVMARRKLGQLVLSCAPRLSEWVAILREPSTRDNAHCLLSS